jgi:tetratricopeptide (TPR) repeat protein
VRIFFLEESPFTDDTFYRYTLNFVKARAKKGSKGYKVKAEDVAQLLARHGVRICVVNACESSKVLESGDMSANLASIFVRNGIQAVVAMSFNAMDSTVEIFIGTLYLYFLAFRMSFGDAVDKARERLRELTHREATLGLKIEIMDFVVPMLYRNVGFNCNDFFATTEKENIEAKSLSELLQLQTGILDFMAPLDLIGRATEISEIETLLGACPILLLHGPGGIGKSAVLWHLMWWWKASGLVEHVIHVDLATNENSPTASDSAKDEHWYAKAIENMIKKAHMPDEASESLIISFFEEKACLLVIDSLDTLNPSNSSQNLRIRNFLEKLVEANEEAFHRGNSFIVLSGRRDHAFEWDTINSIGGYALGDLPLLHGLRYGLRVLSKMFKERPFLADNHETKAYLEYIVEILSGNPLAIEIAFPALGAAGATPRSVFEQILTGSILPEKDAFGDSLSWSWMESGRGAASRFCTAAMELFELARGADAGGIGRLPLLLGMWNCVFPRFLDPQLLFFGARSSPGKKDALLQLQLYMMQENALEDIQALNAEEVSSFFSKLEDRGLIFPVEGDALLVQEYKPEYYRIHPVMTFWLRKFLKDFFESVKAPKDVLMTVADYRQIWDCLHAKAAVARFPPHEHDRLKIRAVEENGKWNLVAAVIHAQRHYIGKPVASDDLSVVSRLMISISSLMRHLPDLNFVLRPYLQEELRRHLESDLLLENEAVLYSAVKLAFSMKFGAHFETWNLIDATMEAVDSYRAKGNIYTGYLEVSYMEIRTTEAVSLIDLDMKKALRLFERNLRYEPCSNDDAMGSIRRDVLSNLRYWAILKLTEQTDGKAGSALPKKAKSDEDRAAPSTKTVLPDEDFAEKFWAGTVQDSPLFQSINPDATKEFSSFVQKIFRGNQLDVIADIAPDREKLVAYHTDTMTNFEQMPELAALKASFQLHDGDPEMAKKEFRRGIEQQLQNSNDAPSRVFLHMELYKIAVKDEEWQTASSHLEQIIKHSPGSGLYKTWIQLAKCCEKAGKPEDARKAALGAYRSARNTSMAGEADKLDVILGCNDDITNLSGIVDWSYIYPKRPRREDCDSVDDDKLNYIMLLKEILEIMNSPGSEDRYTPDGELFRNLVAGCHEYLSLFATGAAAHFTIPAEVSDELRRTLVSLHLLLREFRDQGRLVGGGLEAFREAELCYFSSTRPHLRALANSSWARTVLDRRFPATGGHTSTE